MKHILCSKELTILNSQNFSNYFTNIQSLVYKISYSAHDIRFRFQLTHLFARATQTRFTRECANLSRIRRKVAFEQVGALFHLHVPNPTHFTIHTSWAQQHPHNSAVATTINADENNPIRKTCPNLCRCPLFTHCIEDFAILSRSLVFIRSKSCERVIENTIQIRMKPHRRALVREFVDVTRLRCDDG